MHIYFHRLLFSYLLIRTRLMHFHVFLWACVWSALLVTVSSDCPVVNCCGLHSPHTLLRTPLRVTDRQFFLVSQLVSELRVKFHIDFQTPFPIRVYFLRPSVTDISTSLCCLLQISGHFNSQNLSFLNSVHLLLVCNQSLFTFSQRAL